jgi:hypothetical protein
MRQVCPSVLQEEVKLVKLDQLSTITFLNICI